LVQARVITKIQMPLPSRLVYNDLNGAEVKHVLIERFIALLDQVPYLQKHITLPRVKMELQVQLDTWADQPTPERQTIRDEVDIMGENPPPPLLSDSNSVLLQDFVNASPRGGKTPDQIRDEHGLFIPVPTRGPLAVEDQTVEGVRMTMPSGAVVDRTGNAPERKNATVVIQDFGVAGLAKQKMDRPEVAYGNRRQDGPIAPPIDPRKIG